MAETPLANEVTADKWTWTAVKPALTADDEQQAKSSFYQFIKTTTRRVGTQTGQTSLYVTDR